MFIRDMDFMFPCGSTSSSRSLVHWFTREEDTEVGAGFRQTVDMTEIALREMTSVNQLNFIPQFRE